ncbi:hypothetical protein MHF_1145 [Mycoplasma haemofelis Ohio2]|uniref:Uncharacterized protein n=1 Tax=Mycoplasma haemofelis (strain Ohio2) TaxID=859194 RepID=F6FJN2_MYCHI|nr:hypothetical protein MHF_1145 [Mycoplasma haemofelis Ohio2]
MPSLSLLKVICGGVAATAGTLGIGSFLLPEAPAEESIATKKVSFENREFEDFEEAEREEPVVVEDSEEDEELPAKIDETVEDIKEESEPVIPKCTLYIVEEPRGVGKDRVVTKILSKVTQDQENFLNRKGTQFGVDVRRACPVTMDKPKNIYVWQNYRKSWIYAEDVSTQDWLSKGVAAPKDSKDI